MRKLWAARVLFVLAAGGLGAVVLEERREQAADREPARVICASPHHAQDSAESTQSAQRGCADYPPARAPKSR